MATKSAGFDSLRFLIEGPNSQIVHLLLAALAIVAGIFLIDIFRGNAPVIVVKTNPPPGNILAGSTLHVNYSIRSKRPISSVQIIVNGAVNEIIEQETALLGLRRIRVPVSF